MKYIVNLDHSNTTKINFTIIAILLCLSIISVYLLNLGYETAYGFIPLFNFDMEFNIPSLYSFLSILLCSYLLHFIYLNKNISKTECKYIYHWKALSFIFLYLAFDELMGIHEHLGPLISSSVLSKIGIYNLNISRNWVLIYVLLFGVIGLGFLKFFIHLPIESRFLFAISGVLYVTGAVVLELLDGQLIVADYNSLNLYRYLSSLEELFEMIGIALFIRALILYIENNSYNNNFHVEVTMKTSKQDAIVM